MKRQDELIEAWCNYRGKCSTEIMQALAFALMWCDEHPNWISVEDELPERDEDVLILTPQNLVHIAAYKYRNWQTKAHVFASGIDGYTLDNVTHWMALPSPPEHFADVSKKISDSSEIPNNHTKTIKKGGEQ